MENLSSGLTCRLKHTRFTLRGRIDRQSPEPTDTPDSVWLRLRGLADIAYYVLSRSESILFSMEAGHSIYRTSNHLDKTNDSAIDEHEEHLGECLRPRVTWRCMLACSETERDGAV
jgi:hypothetical protein